MIFTRAGIQLRGAAASDFPCDRQDDWSRLRSKPDEQFHFSPERHSRVRFCHQTKLVIFREKPESQYPDEPRGRSAIAGARVDLNALFRDKTTQVSL
jgi:hypothetical protein